VVRTALECNLLFHGALLKGNNLQAPGNLWKKACFQAIDPAQKICNALSHPSDKNKDVARVGHPDRVATHKGRINKLPKNIPQGLKASLILLL
jgi:hypothetical protein